MKCEITILKENFPDTRNLLLTYLENIYNIHFSYNSQNEKISVYTIENKLKEIKENNLEDMKDNLPNNIVVVLNILPKSSLKSKTNRNEEFLTLDKNNNEINGWQE